MKVLIGAVSLAAMVACSPRNETSSTPLPTRQTTIDPVNKKLDAAQQETEKRRAEIDKAGQ
jgi:hypothetical protein